ncbi:unnamed protein product [Brachionus calyciflorus]|uniref:Uncharacterized protein n=1 Tax=Brachionus calyciflorus TaxID=104777 RepID=A0A814NIE1_9BILA|nr:unnamed protein product [Brachionus calyciflorus]
MKINRLYLPNQKYPQKFNNNSFMSHDLIKSYIIPYLLNSNLKTLVTNGNKPFNEFISDFFQQNLNKYEEQPCDGGYEKSGKQIQKEKESKYSAQSTNNPEENDQEQSNQNEDNNDENGNNDKKGNPKKNDDPKEEDTDETDPEEEEEEKEPEKPKTSRKLEETESQISTPKKRKTSPELAERTPEEQEIIHRYYQKIGHTKATGGVEHRGDIMKTFKPKEQNVIHNFLHQITQKRSRSRSKDSQESPKKRPMSPEMADRSPEEQEIIHKYYQTISTSSGVSHRGEILESFNPRERDIIRSFLSQTGHRGRRTRTKLEESQSITEITPESKEKSTGKTSFLSRYSKAHQKIILKFFHDVSEEKTESEIETTPQKETVKITPIKTRQEEPEEVVQETPKKRGRPKKQTESPSTKQKGKRKSLEKQEGDVEIKVALQRVKDSQSGSNIEKSNNEEKENIPQAKTPRVKKSTPKKEQIQTKKTPFSEKN